MADDNRFGFECITTILAIWLFWLWGATGRGGPESTLRFCCFGLSLFELFLVFVGFAVGVFVGVAVLDEFEVDVGCGSGCFCVWEENVSEKAFVFVCVALGGVGFQDDGLVFEEGLGVV